MTHVFMLVHAEAAVDWLIDGAFGGDFGSLGGLNKTVAEYNTSAYNLVNTLHTTVVKPVSAVIIAIMFVLELARNSTHIESDRELGVKIIAATMFKCALLLIAAQHADLILKAFNEVGDTITLGMMRESPDLKGTQASYAAKISQMWENTSWGDTFKLFFLFLVPWVVNKLAKILLIIIVFYRFAEIYILSAFVTLPIAFMGHPDTKSVAVGYLRKYAAALLHGAIIVLVCSIYVAFMGNGLEFSAPKDNLGDWVSDNWVSLMVKPLLFIFLLFGSSRLAKSLVGE